MNPEEWKGLAALAFLILLNVGLLIYRLKHPNSAPVKHYGCQSGSCSIPAPLPDTEAEEQ